MIDAALGFPNYYATAYFWVTAILAGVGIGFIHYMTRGRRWKRNRLTR